MRQAPLTIGDYLDEAVHQIDRQFGEGYAMKNPALVAAFLNCCATDFNTGVIGQAIQMVSQSLNNISSSLTAEQ